MFAYRLESTNDLADFEHLTTLIYHGVFRSGATNVYNEYMKSIGSHFEINRYDHPCPFDDPLLGTLSENERLKLICGFSTIDQMKIWFPNRNAMKHTTESTDLTLRKYEIEADGYYHGKTQCMFCPEKIISVQQLDIMEQYDEQENGIPIM